MGGAWTSINAWARAEGHQVPDGQGRVGRPSAWHACLACAQAVGAVGAGLSLVAEPGLGEPGLREPVLATGPASEELQELQFTLGQGPSWDAAASGTPVLVDDLSAPGARRRWPVFAAAAVRRGVRGMFALPVSAGATQVGVLDLYRLKSGPLTGDELADVLAYTDAVLVLVLDDRPGITPPLDQLDHAGFIERRAQVHQAAGMVSVQLGAGVTDALARLSAYAFVHDRPVTQVAADVVARRLRFHSGDDAEDDGTSCGPTASR